MIRPGDRLRALVARWCSAPAMERLIDPAIADLQAEYADAVHEGGRWRGRWVWLAGHVALLKVVACHGWEQSAGSLGDWTPSDRRDAIRGIALSAAWIAGATLLLLVPVFLTVAGEAIPPSATPFLIPQALPLSIPVGLMFGILVSLGGLRGSSRVRALVLLLALVSSLTSFALVGWGIPAANTSFRAAASPSMHTRLGEMTWSEMGRLLEPSEDVTIAPGFRRHLAREYHKGVALSCAPLVLGLFALSVTRRRYGMWMLGSTGCAAVVGYYALMFAGRELELDRVLPIAAVAWIPNVTFVMLALTLSTTGPPRPTPIAAL